MYVEGISLGYMEMEILSGLRTFACEGRPNCRVMFGSEVTSVQPSLRLRVYKRVRISLYRQWVMN